MARVATAKPMTLVRPPALVDTISTLRHEFCRLQDELREAHNEIKRLKRKLSTAQRPGTATAGIDIGALRRQLAYYCHPDRGGDTELMCSLNVLLDVLETGGRGHESVANTNNQKAAA